jgi:putative ABC transport system substrate-binding protein
MAINTGRRQLIFAVGGAAAWPLSARAQQAVDKRPTIGFLGGNASVWNPWRAAFVERLRQLGWIEDRTVAIEYRWTEGHPERAAELAAELVRLKVNVIVTFSPATMAVKQATSDIPIVFAIGNDPIGTGLIASLARPGGNVTGLSIQTTDLAAKQLEILREIVPGLSRLAIMADVGDPDGVLEMRVVQTTARTLGIEITPLEIQRPDDISAAFSALKADALYVVQGSLVGANQSRIITSALSLRLPTTFAPRDHVKAGALMSYGADFPDLFRRTADIVDKILRGTKPSDIPVEQPTKFDLVINLTTAKALGLTVPANLLALADEVIE